MNRYASDCEEDDDFDVNELHDDLIQSGLNIYTNINGIRVNLHFPRLEEDMDAQYLVIEDNFTNHKFYEIKVDEHLVPFVRKILTGGNLEQSSLESTFIITEKDVRREKKLRYLTSGETTSANVYKDCVVCAEETLAFTPCCSQPLCFFCYIKTKKSSNSCPTCRKCSFEPSNRVAFM
jgi:hypothetical protein